MTTEETDPRPLSSPETDIEPSADETCDSFRLQQLEERQILLWWLAVAVLCGLLLQAYFILRLTEFTVSIFNVVSICMGLYINRVGSLCNYVANQAPQP